MGQHQVTAESLYRVPYEKYEKYLGKAQLSEDDRRYLESCLKDCIEKGGKAASACCFGICGRYAKERQYIEHLLSG